MINFVTLLLALSPLIAVADTVDGIEKELKACVLGAKTAGERTVCHRAAFAAAGEELKTAFQVNTNSLHRDVAQLSDPKVAAFFQFAQISWLNYRRDNCKYIGMATVKTDEVTPDENESACLAGMTIQHIKELR